MICDKDVANEYYALIVRGSAGGDPVTLARVAGAATDLCDTTSGYSANAWHHACGVVRTNQDVSVYIDGGSKGNSIANRSPANLDRTCIGYSGDSAPGDYMSGRIAEVAAWNVALTDDEVAALAGGVPPPRMRPESLVAYWPLAGIGSPEPDYRGVYDMTLFNAPTTADHAPVGPMFGYDD